MSKIEHLYQAIEFAVEELYDYAQDQAELAEEKEDLQGKLQIAIDNLKEANQIIANLKSSIVNLNFYLGIQKGLLIQEMSFSEIFHHTLYHNVPGNFISAECLEGMKEYMKTREKFNLEQKTVDDFIMQSITTQV